ncbi:MAG: pilin [Acidobacteriota bacterium]
MARIIRIALGFLGIILLCLILYGGYLWMMAGGNEEQIGTAKRVLTNAVIGLIIILSAWAIVTFVLRLFGLSGGGGSGLSAPNSQNFQGSGALGGIVKDHYPSRDQTEVPRNTKIIITFRAPVLLEANFVNDINAGHQGNVLGDCQNIGPTMNWKTDCDALKLDDNYINIRRADTGEPISGANILASYENGKVYTIVIRPYDYLGSSEENIPYAVRIGKNIRLDDAANKNPYAFSRGVIGNDYYAWKFTCSTFKRAK